MAKHSSQARKLRRELDAQLAEAAAESGTELTFSAEEEQLIEQIMATIDRREELQSLYDAAEDIKDKVKLAGEVRLSEGHIERMLRRVSTEAPAQAKPMSKTSMMASRAANARWARERAGA